MAAIRRYRHPDCARCARLAGWHRRLDWLGRFEDSTGVSPVGPLRRGQVVLQDLRSGQTLHGADASALLCRQIPAYWPLLSAVRRAVERELGGRTDDRCDTA